MTRLRGHILVSFPLNLSASTDFPFLCFPEHGSHTYVVVPAGHGTTAVLLHYFLRQYDPAGARASVVTVAAAQSPTALVASMTALTTACAAASAVSAAAAETSFDPILRQLAPADVALTRGALRIVGEASAPTNGNAFNGNDVCCVRPAGTGLPPPPYPGLVVLPARWRLGQLRLAAWRTHARWTAVWGADARLDLGYAPAALSAVETALSAGTHVACGPLSDVVYLNTGGLVGAVSQELRLRERYGATRLAHEKEQEELQFS